MSTLLTHPGQPGTVLPPVQVHAHFLHAFPAGELPGPFIEVASQAYVYALALYFAQPSTRRPASTLENVRAAVRYGRPEQVLGLLQREPACVNWTLQLTELLTRGAHWQVQATLHFIDLVFDHVNVSAAAEQQVFAYLRAYDQPPVNWAGALPADGHLTPQR